MDAEYHRQKSREHYLKYKKTYDVRWKKQKARNRKIIHEAKIHGCILCPELDLVCLDFHHLNSKEKDRSVADMLGHSEQTLRKEIEKCIVLCRNCHAKVHAKKITLKAQVAQRQRQ